VTTQTGNSPTGYEWVVRGLWVLLLFAIPITSFPPIGDRLGDDVAVSPLSMLPLAILVVVWLIPWLLRGGRIAFLGWPLLLFAIWALSTSAVAWFQPLDPTKGQTVASRELRAVLTLGVGLAFYFTASSIPRSEKALRWALIGLYLGGIATLIWSSVQADYVVRGLNNVPQRLNQVHRWFSIRDLQRDRVSGFAFEPSWLGDQLVVLYLPLWLGAVLRRTSLLPWRRGWLLFETPLLVWSIWILLLTRSRLSLLAFLLMAALVAIVLLWKLIGRIESRLTAGRWRSGAGVVALRAGMLAGVMVALVVIGLSLLRRGAEVDWRMRRAIRLPTEFAAIQQEYPYATTYEVANRLAFAERLVYWRAGLEGFMAQPLLGVGLGNAGFLFEQGVPAYGYGLVEIRGFLKPSNPNFPNPKNLWVRLAAETGLPGLASYMVWILMTGLVGYGLSRQAGIAGWVGLAGGLSLVGQLVEGFSLDSFTLPQVWIMNGLVAAAALIALKTAARRPTVVLPNRRRGDASGNAPDPVGRLP